MKNRLIYRYLLLFALAGLSGCEMQTMPESVRIQYPGKQSPLERDDAYYARLRAYKKTDHKLAFGWYGSWTAIGASEQSRLGSAPDSMDILSMWSKWHSLSKEQIADKAFVQQTKGTRVVFCISAKDVPAEFKEDGQITDASLVAYARAWAKDSMDKYQYDGIDIDFELAVDHQGPLNTTPGLFKKFCQELSQYIGPKSNTGRLFLIDGNIDGLDQGISELCDYGVSQAYGTSDADNLRYRISGAARSGWKAEQLIFTENFESYWQTGGVNYSYNGEEIPSLLGMAHFAADGESAGFGAYHMEYEYGHSDKPYKYMREAIQIANPAPKGDFSKNLLSINEAGEKRYSIVVFPSGASETLTTTATGGLSAVAAADADLCLRVDNSLVTPYNDYNYTEYRTLDPSLVVFSGPLHFAKGSRQSAEPVTITIADFSKVEDGQYLVPVRADFPKGSAYSSNTDKEILYLVIDKMQGFCNVSLGEAGQVAGINVHETGDGMLIGDVSLSVSAGLSRPAPGVARLPLVVDPSLVEAYNEAHGTGYAAVAAADVAVSGKLLVEAGADATSSVEVSMPDLSKLTAKNSMIAVRVDLSGETDYQFADKRSAVKYILVNKLFTNVEAEATSVPGTPIADRTGWTYTISNFGDKSALMFNDIVHEEGWCYAWGTYTATVDMAASRTLAGWRTGVPVKSGMSWPASKLYNVQTSADGVTWTDQDETGEVALGPADGDGWQYLKFYTPVECRYVRMTYKKTLRYVGCSEFSAIAPQN